MESAAASGPLSSRTAVAHDPFVTVVNISQSQPLAVPAPQAFYQNPQYHSVLEGRKLSVQVPNESPEAAEERVTFVTVLDVGEGTKEGSPAAVSLPEGTSALTSDSVTMETGKLGGDQPSSSSAAAHTTELVTLYRLPGERLGLGLKFRGGETAQQPVQAVSVQSCAEGSPSARADCSWGQLQAGDQILAVAGRSVTTLTRLRCVQLLQEAPLAVELKVRHITKRELLVSQDSGISLGGERTSREPSETRERSPPVEPAAPLVATDALAAQEAWLQAALESDGSSCSSRSSTSTIVERPVSRLPPPPPALPLDLASALSQFERLERELSMDSVFAAEGAEEAASVSPLPPPEVFQDRPEATEADTELAVGGSGMIRREPSSAAEEDEGFHDAGGSSGASPPTRHRELSEDSREDERDIQSDEPSMEDGEVHDGKPEESSRTDEMLESGDTCNDELVVSPQSLGACQAADAVKVAEAKSEQTSEPLDSEATPTPRSDLSEEPPASSSAGQVRAPESNSAESEETPESDSETTEETPSSSSEISEEPEPSVSGQHMELGTEHMAASGAASSDEETSGDIVEATDHTPTEGVLADYVPTPTEDVLADYVPTPTEGVLADYVPTPMPRKRTLVLVPTDSDDDFPEDDFSAVSDSEPSPAPPAELKPKLPSSKDHSSMSFEVSSAAERRRKASAQDDTLAVLRHSSDETDPERPASVEDSHSEDSAVLPATSGPGAEPSVIPSVVRCRDSSPESPPPPSGTRQPPDGHEFPPDFGDPRPSSATPTSAPAPALLRPPSRFSDRGASPTAEKAETSSHIESGRTMGVGNRGRYHRSGSLGGATTRIGESELTSGLLRRATTRERQSVEDLQRTAGRSVLGGRSPRGQTSVKDKIALFSSQSVEQLAQPHPKLHKHKSLENDLPTRGPIRSQARSKSDLKLSETEAPRSRPGDVLARRKRISEGRGPRFGSMLNMHISERRDSDSRASSGDNKAAESPKPSDGSPVTPQPNRPPPSQRYLRGTSDLGELVSPCSDSVTSLSERPARYRETSPGLLAERSQSLFDLGHPEKRHSFAGLQDREFSYSGHSGSLTRKVSLNSITEERKRSLSRLRGLVIPDKVDGLAKKGPVDLPTIKSKGLSSLSSSSFRSSSSSSPAPSPRQRTSSRPEKLDCHQLTSPPWKAESPNIQKYSPAFKRKNISVLSPSSPSGSAFHFVSTSSQLGGSSVELSRPSRRDFSLSSPLPRDPRSAGRRSEPRSPRPRLADTVEPLQRSSSLNSRPLSASVQLRRKISDDDAADLRSRLEPADSDCGGSTLTLVNEPADSDEPELSGRGRAGSLEFDHRASTSTLHESPVKELDVEEELLRAAEQLHSRASDTELQTRWSAAGGSPSPPRMLDDDSWRKFAGERRPSAPPPGACETRDLSKLRQVTKNSMASLKQKWQQLGVDGQEAEATPVQQIPSYPENTDESGVTGPQSPPASPSPSPSSPSPSPSTDVNNTTDPPVDVTDSPADVSSPTPDSAWPSIQKDRSGIDRKLSTPSYSSSDLILRERKDSVPSRPHSWMESERELGSYLGPSSITSSQENIMDSLDSAKSPSGSTSSLLEMLTANLKSTARSRHALSVSDLRRAFERWDGRPHSGTSGHARMSSLDSSASEDGHGGCGSTASPTTARDHYGSITSLASSTSLISPHELQQLIDEANQSLEEAGTPSHEIIVAVIHREMMGGSIGVTLAGGADYENKEISVNKVITGSVADRDGRIKKGDRVISINGRSSKGMSHREALNTLKAPRAEVVLVLSRSRSVTPHDPSSEDQRPSISAMYSRPPKILESPMDSKSLASELAQEDEFRGPAVTIALKKEGAGLGFSLQGGKDSPLGDRPLVAKKIFTGGAADKSGLLHVRDQILAINDQDITLMARIEAWNLLKKQPDGMVRLTIRKWLPQGPTATGADTAASSAVQPLAPTPEPAASLLPAAVTRPAPRSTVSRPDTRPVITGVTPKSDPLASAAVILPQA